MKLPVGWRGGVLRDRGGARAAVAPVVKCGGSLLARRGWPDELRACHDALAGAGPPLLVVGGGAIVDGLRRIDAAGGHDPVLVHALAIELMAVTGRLVAAELGLGIVAAPDGGGVLDAAAFLATAGQGLPCGWEVTSDSIAALAAGTARRGLVLLKSVPPPQGTPQADGAVRGAAAAGWVDAWFPQAAADVDWIGWACPPG